MANRLLLCTDLDRTLIPNGAQPESARARERFRQLISHASITLTYVTGRDKALVEQAISDYNLPVPDYVVADVGATIYKLEHEQWHVWEVWSSRFKGDWKGHTNKDIAKFFADVDELTMQEASKQKPFKLSYYVPLDVDHRALINSMQQRLLAVDLDCELIWSVDEPKHIGLLDVMPKHATKRNAIEFLMHTNRFDLNHTLFAGDSGNDLDVMLSPIKSILVANAHEDVKKTVIEVLSTQDNHDTVYLAQGGFEDMNGNYCAGILEGIRHYVPDIDTWREEQP